MKRTAVPFATGLLSLFFFAAPLEAQVAPLVVKIGLTSQDQEKYLRFMKGKLITGRLSFHSPDLDSSPVLDTILINRALTLGGLHFLLTLVEIPNSERERAMVLSGVIALAGTSQWDFFVDENKDSLYQSEVIVPDGSFEKGLYTTKEKRSTFKVRTVGDLTSLTCVTNSNWLVDWRTVTALGFKKVEDTPTVAGMFRLVAGGRADVTVQSFSGNPDLSIASEGITLFPVVAVKVLLKGARYFVVSKKAPQSREIFESLQRGLVIMKKSDEINRALVETGFRNPAVRDWRTLRLF